MNFRPLTVAALAVTPVLFVLASQTPASADRPGYYYHHKPDYHSGTAGHHGNTYVIAANGAAITAMPSSDAEIVAELEESTRVVILDTTSFTGSTFHYIEVLGSGSRGWINANLVQPAH